MKLEFLGTGGAFQPQSGNNAAFFWRGDTLFLLDCGETVFTAIMKRDLLARAAGVVVLLTHLHADHCGSLSTLCLYARHVRKLPVTVVHPHEQAQTLLSLMGAGKAGIEFLDDYSENGLNVRALPVSHANMPAFAYLLTDACGTIYYSGDADSLRDDVLEGFLRGDICRLYVDIGDGAPHMKLEALEAAVPKTSRGRVTCMHISPENRARAMALGFETASVAQFGGRDDVQR